MGDAFNLLVQGTPVELMALFIVSGYFGVWYWGRAYNAIVVERNEWKAMAMSATSLAKDQTSQIAQLTEVVETLSHASRRQTR
jgi:hypothetical protein